MSAQQKIATPSCDCPKLLQCCNDTLTCGPLFSAFFLPVGWEKMTVLQIRTHCHSQVAGEAKAEPIAGFEIWYLERPTARAIVAP